MAVCGVDSELWFGERLCLVHLQARRQAAAAAQKRSDQIAADERRRADEAAAEVAALEMARQAKLEAERLAAWNAIPGLSVDDLVRYLRGQVAEATESGPTHDAERRLRPFPADEVVHALRAVGLPVQAMVFQMDGMLPGLPRTARDLSPNKRKKEKYKARTVSGWIFATAVSFMNWSSGHGTAWSGIFLTTDGRVSRFEAISHIGHTMDSDVIDFRSARGAHGDKLDDGESAFEARRSGRRRERFMGGAFREWLISREISVEEIRLIGQRTRRHGSNR